MFHLELKITIIQSSDPSQSCCISSNFIRHNEMLHNHIIWVCRALVFIFLGLVGLINMWKVSKNAYFYRILKISHGGHLWFERLQNSSLTVSEHLNLISDSRAQHFICTHWYRILATTRLIFCIFHLELKYHQNSINWPPSIMLDFVKFKKTR